MQITVLILIVFQAFAATAATPTNDRIDTEPKLCAKLFWDLHRETHSYRTQSAEKVVTPFQLDLVKIANPSVSPIHSEKNSNLRAEKIEIFLLKKIANELAVYGGDIHILSPDNDGTLSKFYLAQKTKPIIALAKEALPADLYKMRDYFHLWRAIDKKLNQGGLARDKNSRDLAWRLLQTPHSRLLSEKRAMLAEMTRSPDRMGSLTAEELIKASNYPETAAITAAAIYIQSIDKTLAQPFFRGDRAGYLSMRSSLESFSKRLMDELILRTRVKYKMAKKFYELEFNLLPAADKEFIVAYKQKDPTDGGTWLFDMREPLTDPQRSHLRMLNFAQDRTSYSDFVPSTPELSRADKEVRDYIEKLFKDRYKHLFSRRKNETYTQPSNVNLCVGGGC